MRANIWRISCYSLRVMSLRTCLVIFQDTRGSRHSVEVSAASLYEAVVLGYGELKKNRFLEDSPGPATRLEVEIREPIVRHSVTLLQVQQWLDEQSANPSMQARKQQLRAMMASR